MPLMMASASDSRMVLFGDGESKLSLLCCDDEPEEAAALHLMPNIQVCNVCVELEFLSLSRIKTKIHKIQRGCLNKLSLI